ncbi:hypothetical protein [Moorena sp. SIO4G3]|uniref:hypothetical protein n=1 Tax=Moorena sp. SIO4G3 TaxID=2607821 RepID=UPI001428F7BD|nr:hypothetical protein [Moorena sp. SIO4G3]NEO79790.1 hypothetical protein [Moorena sp. SIO4G3]
MLFDTVVRYGAGYPKPGYEAENEAPLTHPTQLILLGNKTPDIFPILPLAFPSWEGLGVG